MGSGRLFRYYESNCGTDKLPVSSPFAPKTGHLLISFRSLSRVVGTMSVVYSMQDYLANVLQPGRSDCYTLFYIFSSRIPISPKPLRFPDNEIVLPVLGFLISLPCFYIITQMPDYQQSGRFILLTYVRYDGPSQ